MLVNTDEIKQSYHYLGSALYTEINRGQVRDRGVGIEGDSKKINV